jgi:hypothetical protein
MALLGNTGLNARGPVRNFGITGPGNERASWHQSGMTKNFSLHDGRPTGGNKTGYPSGRVHPYSWSMPFKPGGMASVLDAQGVATVSGAMAAGINITGTSDGVATTSGVGQLVVSGTGTADGVATVSGNLQAALIGTGAADGTSTASGTLQALGWAVGASDGVATVTGTLTATGKLVGSIAPAVELDAATFSTYLLDQEDVESGLTLRKALRLIAASTAGKVSGAEGTTVTIKNAVADSKARMVVSCDADGNRSVITYDLDD